MKDDGRNKNNQIFGRNGAPAAIYVEGNVKHHTI
jgi:hypothetical protein